ncbi:hypothetical protein PCASD_02966 [Puccinia coronata f. sp. avenae]|uniref:Uncharacterized protein n=1 Tax=Puccinia coronata f. sp. avenae TaxID=200324 RepID=A0A2N5VGR5_9BASI|nr:hypothetical protein PCASD_02966 [Puccinia coronata f. sp. avenae]
MTRTGSSLHSSSDSALTSRKPMYNAAQLHILLAAPSRVHTEQPANSIPMPPFVSSFPSTGWGIIAPPAGELNRVYTNHPRHPPEALSEARNASAVACSGGIGDSPVSAFTPKHKSPLRPRPENLYLSIGHHTSNHPTFFISVQVQKNSREVINLLLDDLNFVCNYKSYDANTTASILPPHDFPEGNEVNPTIWTAIQDNRHVEEPKKVKTRAKKGKKAATQSVTAPTSQGGTAANNAMDVDQRERSSATPMPMTPQPAVRPVDALGAAANALPSIPPQAKKRDNSPEMGSEEACLALMISKTSGPQRPGGNNPVPPINTLKEQAQIALVMLNTHYDSYVGANNRHHLAIAEMHLRQCIAAQETLCSQVGDAMTITLSQGWSAKYQLSKLKEWMRQHLPQAANHPVQSFTTTKADQGYHPQTTHANSTPYPQPNIAPGSYPQTPVSSQLNQQVNPAPKYCPRAPMPNQAAEAPPAPPFQGPPRAGEDDGHGRIPPASFGLYGPQRSFQVGPIQSPPEMKVTSTVSPPPPSTSASYSRNKRNLCSEIVSSQLLFLEKSLLATMSTIEKNITDKVKENTAKQTALYEEIKGHIGVLAGAVGNMIRENSDPPITGCPTELGGQAPKQKVPRGRPGPFNSQCEPLSPEELEDMPPDLQEVDNSGQPPVPPAVPRAPFVPETHVPEQKGSIDNPIEV